MYAHIGNVSTSCTVLRFSLDDQWEEAGTIMQTSIYNKSSLLKAKPQSWLVISLHTTFLNHYLPMFVNSLWLADREARGIPYMTKGFPPKDVLLPDLTTLETKSMDRWLRCFLAMSPFCSQTRPPCRRRITVANCLFTWNMSTWLL